MSKAKFANLGSQVWDPLRMPWTVRRVGVRGVSIVHRPSLYSAGVSLSVIEHRCTDRASLLDEGFAAGRAVKHKGGQLSTIVSIEDDGKVVLSAIGLDGEAGEPQTVPFDDFAANYTPTMSNVEVMSDWKERRPSSNRAHNDYVAKALVTLGLRQLAQSAVGEDLLRVHTKPSRSVSVSGAVGKGKLVTVAETMKMQVVRPAEVVEGSLVVNLPSEFGGKVVVLLPHFASDFAVPAWAIKSTDVQDDANVEFVFKPVTIDVGGGKGQGKGRSSVELRLPVLTNTKALTKDTELFVYRASTKRPALKRGFASLNLMEVGPAQKRG